LDDASFGSRAAAWRARPINEAKGNIYTLQLSATHLFSGVLRKSHELRQIDGANRLLLLSASYILD